MYVRYVRYVRYMRTYVRTYGCVYVRSLGGGQVAHSGAIQYVHPWDVAVSPTGDMFLSDYSSTALYRYVCDDPRPLTACEEESTLAFPECNQHFECEAGYGGELCDQPLYNCDASYCGSAELCGADMYDCNWWQHGPYCSEYVDGGGGLVVVVVVVAIVGGQWWLWCHNRPTEPTDPPPTHRFVLVSFFPPALAKCGAFFASLRSGPLTTRTQQPRCVRTVGTWSWATSTIRTQAVPWALQSRRRTKSSMCRAQPSAAIRRPLSVGRRSRRPLGRRCGG